MATSLADYTGQLRQFLRQELRTTIDGVNLGTSQSRDVVAVLGREGFFAPCFRLSSTVHAGTIPLNVPFFDVLIRELAQNCPFGLTLTVAIHIGVFVPLVLRLSQGDASKTLVSEALQGNILGGIAVTEQHVAGSDFMSMETTATLRGDGITLQGSKHYITNGTTADYLIVFARWRPTRNFASYSALLVPTGLDGITRTAIPMAIMKAADIGHVDFDSVMIDRGAILGRKELGLRYFLEHIAVERLVGGIWAVASAEQCIMETREYAKHRLVGTGSLWERSAVRHKVAEAIASVTLLKALVEGVESRFVHSGQIDQVDTAIIKAAVAPMMERIFGLCVQIQGARGLELDSHMLRNLNDFRAFGIAGGATETMLDIVADRWECDSHVVAAV